MANNHPQMGKKMKTTRLPAFADFRRCCLPLIPNGHLLLFYPQLIPLSEKENQLLSLFVAHWGKRVTREELLKKVWEEEGVIIGRSLNVFSCKLRKKL